MPHATDILVVVLNHFRHDWRQSGREPTRSTVRMKNLYQNLEAALKHHNISQAHSHPSFNGKFGAQPHLRLDGGQDRWNAGLKFHLLQN